MDCPLQASGGASIASEKGRIPPAFSIPISRIPHRFLHERCSKYSRSAYHWNGGIEPSRKHVREGNRWQELANPNAIGVTSS